MYTLTELCNELSINPATGRNWIKLGKLKPSGKKGRSFTFSDDYVHSLKRDLESGKLKSLRSRRNKSYISGNLLYSSYIPASSPNIALIQKLVADIAALDQKEPADNADDNNPGEAALKSKYAHRDASAVPYESSLIPKVLYACAKVLISKRTNEECSSAYNELLYDLYPCCKGSEDTANCDSSLGAVGEYITFDKAQKISTPNLTYVPGEDTLGLIYISLKHMQERKTQGSYYTPGNIVQRLLGHLFEKSILTDGQDKVILDPGCGSGNFLLCLPPGIPADNIYGYDTDEVSAKLARINLALKYRLPDSDFWNNHIKITDFLHKDSEEKRFDIILGNPPWGSSFNGDEKEFLKKTFATGKAKSPDSYDLFIEQGIRLLKNGGALSFVLPESVLLVKSHTISRKLLLQETSLTHLEYLGDVFDHVQCPSIILQAQKNEGESNFLKNKPVIYEKDSSFCITTYRKLSENAFDFLVTDEEYSLMESLENLQGVRYLEGNAEFALGIVTGANKDMLMTRKSPKNEIILKGTDIFKYFFKKPKCYITFEPEKYQQVAPVSMYRAPQKLLYRFIGGHLIFAYDDSQTLSLNSCNIVIPNIENLSIKYILAILNCSVCEYYFRKKFRSVKVLRSHIERLPIPYADKETQLEIEGIVDRILSISRNKNVSNSTSQSTDDELKSLYGKIDKICFKLFCLTPENIALIDKCINGENLSVSV